ncbi:hypothetical protein N7457_005734 [Penicillium paradoxum]|uniref:uncharacterized protein n=1 Tax=Penicillium paradoxum TaxID=176176 RepID=UPI0025478997|nr:uncharacterized protein N7457_005734 [Penicillium paradoxum]KAJ5780574.1 hypothetical protein N7457_005734 [Penicillium paradoxum]
MSSLVQGPCLSSLPTASNLENNPVKEKKNWCFSLIERVILSAGAMLIFSVYFLLTICPEGRKADP